MTKSELIETIKNKDIIIAELNDRIDELEAMAISSQAVPMDAEASNMLTLMNQRIQALEEQISEKT